MRRYAAYQAGGESQIKQKIFAAARRLFVEKGYHNTSIPDIVTEAGVSIGALYHYFESKEALAKAIHIHAVQEFLQRFHRQVKSKHTTRERIQAFVEMMFSWTEEDPVMVEYLLYARPKEVLDRAMSICSEEGLQAVKEIMIEGMRRGEVKQVDIMLLVAPVSGTIIRLIELKLDGLLSYPLTEVAETAAQIIWEAVRA
ncbi:transcriptional regulator, TetR family [Thermanaeromonas toyohensis ToBE]|uniref:Transcriptional regulator, TetR family n=1 Tax=Thermanaeromonas toyohensis ToBE TaxID=698762 RepID=A0A1W1W363_9FIRM|nr:TetR/AcrR family transcriptional regulator [Thermanaeromonas toyohensis]SMC00072.1 transcriptional regulator, TetR family [Thermanaeromonas toyohensis ToBE]